MNFHSEIYTEQFTEKDADEVRHYREYRSQKNSLLVYHHSYYTRIMDQIRELPHPGVLVFHNVTPPEFVAPYNRHLAQDLEHAKEGLRSLKDRFQCVVADSGFNAGELTKLGFPPARIMPVAMDFSPAEPGDPSPPFRFILDGSDNILFVGRIFPNKKHQDLIKSFYFFQKIRPRSRLILVGAFHPGVRGYSGELKNLVNELGLREKVVFTGMVSQRDLHAIYRHSRLFLSMSEHEGFFVPLLECMHFHLPILAYASSVIPETLGESGVLFYEKDHIRVAEMMEEILSSDSLRERIVTAQKKRLSHFSLQRSLSLFSEALRDAGVELPSSLPLSPSP